MPTVDLTAGTIHYLDTGGDGPVAVLLHGVNMDATLWRHVVAHLGANVRCICPTLPLGSHQEPMDRTELVTHRGVSAMVGELLEALDLEDVALVLNDWGGAQFLMADGPSHRIAGAALVACEAFENFPPGRPGKAVAASARVPGLLWVSMQLQRFGWFRSAPGGWGWMSKTRVPDEVMDSWFEPAQRDPRVRRDLKTFALSTPSRQELQDLVSRLASFDRPVLVAWATEDRLMPREHGRQLAELFPRARLVEIEGSYTLVPEDQPERLAAELLRFITEDVAA
ncbi:alpha/beta hydrolase [Phytoactinopolyspora alkaliphila]|uniref:Alpha/beta hydrolase n=2 Tax=Phytoactinopolyspora alkaliphila TaxID=1783498 RepID=A0A6N9YPX8_9ACTN|nr:alpha/beta hydrolase [Phytoactinopolyspora alkaliphila]NED97063.1 alpha/beta hydrolase [Phytoactinopolyspora alkaliphila]